MRVLGSLLQHLSQFRYSLAAFFLNFLLWNLLKIEVFRWGAQYLRGHVIGEFVYDLDCLLRRFGVHLQLYYAGLQPDARSVRPMHIGSVAT